MKKHRTLAEMACDAARTDTGHIECPRCGCRDFRTYGKHTATIRYKQCRHCDYKIVTATRERIIREVRHQENEDTMSIQFAETG